MIYYTLFLLVINNSNFFDKQFAKKYSKLINAAFKVFCIGEIDHVTYIIII